MSSSSLNVSLTVQETFQIDFAAIFIHLEIFFQISICGCRIIRVPEDIRYTQFYMILTAKSWVPEYETCCGYRAGRKFLLGT